MVVAVVFRLRLLVFRGLRPVVAVVVFRLRREVCLLRLSTTAPASPPDPSEPPWPTQPAACRASAVVRAALPAQPVCRVVAVPVAARARVPVRVHPAQRWPTRPVACPAVLRSPMPTGWSRRRPAPCLPRRWPTHPVWRLPRRLLLLPCRFPAAEHSRRDLPPRYPLLRFLAVVAFPVLRLRLCPRAGFPVAVAFPVLRLRRCLLVRFLAVVAFPVLRLRLCPRAGFPVVVGSPVLRRPQSRALWCPNRL